MSAFCSLIDTTQPVSDFVQIGKPFWPLFIFQYSEKITFIKGRIPSLESSVFIPEKFFDYLHIVFFSGSQTPEKFVKNTSAESRRCVVTTIRPGWKHIFKIFNNRSHFSQKL